MQGWWVIQALNVSPAFLATWIFWVIFSICLHELGHGWAAIWQGDRTPIERGHMTWNPFVHMGPLSLLFFALFGFASGAMPVNPHRFRSRHGDALVAAAGPLVNLILALFCLAGLAVLVRVVSGASIDPAKTMNLFMFLHAGLGLNILLILFNLFPIPPLDGSRILASFFPAFDRFFEGERGQFLVIIGSALLFFVVGPKLAAISFDMSDALAKWVM